MRKDNLVTRRLALITRLIMGLVMGLIMGLVVTACTETDTDTTEQHERAGLDTRLETHAVLPGPPSVAGLTYVQAIADAHHLADRSEPKAALAVLMTALEQTPPAGDGTAELLHFELLARTSELLLTQREPERALKLLAPLLGPERSLPIDRASARCLVALGDAATQTGDHTQAMGSYARALELLTLLLEEVET